VIVPVDRLDAHDYASLFAVLRTSAPCTAVICAPPLRAKPAPLHEPAVVQRKSRDVALVP